MQMTRTHGDDLKERIARTVGTPSVVIDLDVVDANIARVQRRCHEAGVANRPHIKTHKNSELALRQVAAGAIGVACQKVGEADAMLDAGILDILVCTNVLGAARSGRLRALLKRAGEAADVKLAADNPVALSAYSEAAAAAGRPVGVLVECDTGRKRAGVETPEEVLALARHARDDPHLVFRGLLLYPAAENWEEAQAFLDSVRDGLAALDLTAEIISTGGTPNLANLGRLSGVTEHRAGTSIFNDRQMMACGAAELADCALTIYTTVVSRAAPGRGILDAGSKTLTSDKGDLDGHGFILEYPEAAIARLSEEHGHLDLSAVANPPKIGDIVRVVPNHVCVVVNMVDRVVGVRDGRIERILTVEARGRLV